MGGVYNTVNLHLHHYAGNNPVKYIDPTGRDDLYYDVNGQYLNTVASETTDVHGRTSVERYSGCTTVEDGSNGLTVSIFSRFLSTLPDVFTHLPEKYAKFYFRKMQQLNKI